MKYPDERKEVVLKKLLPLHNCNVAQLAEGEGISAVTVYNWRKQARARCRLLPQRSAEPEGRRARDKFKPALESAVLSEAELAEYCRPPENPAWLIQAGDQE